MLRNSTSSTTNTDYTLRIERLLEHYLSKYCSLSPLYEPIKYSALGGGKRIRPLVTYSIGSAISTPLPQLDIAACALELVHSYSLIHDDLPAMDDDDMRRGKPSCHKAFDEATAILTGDAILAVAFEIISTPTAGVSPATQLNMTSILARVSGPCGIAGGQKRDLDSTTATSESELNTIHREKTASLFIAAAELAYNESYDHNSLRKLGEMLGMAFQLQDDLLETTTTASMLGKPTNSDQKNAKQTHYKLHGLSYANDLLKTYKRDINHLIQSDFASNHILKKNIELIFNRIN